MTPPDNGRRRITTADIAKDYADGVRIPMLTAYDYPTAQIFDEAGIQMLLVGDSLGQVMLGYETTTSVTIEDMLHHTRAVMRGAQRALVVADLPFLSYASVDDAVHNAGRLVREGGAQAVKLEGGTTVERQVGAIVRSGIPVMGHIGWTPQAQHGMGGKVRVQGKSREQARALLDDARALQDAGAFSIVLELVPEQLARAITERLRIPTIGIGAGLGCSGQVQVYTDAIGLGDFVPRHARRYAEVRQVMLAAAQAFAADVSSGAFPSEAESTRMDDAVLDEVLGRGHEDLPEEWPSGSGMPLDQDL